MKVISLDISSKTGFAIFQDGKLVNYGVLTSNKNSMQWPWDIIDRVKEVTKQIVDKVAEDAYDKIIIERTNSSSFRASQDFLSWIHLTLLLELIKTYKKDQITYVNTSDWRKKIQLSLNKEQKKQNQLISKERKKGNKVVKVNGKRIGRITKKHLSVAFVNSTFNLSLKLKDNDIADAIACGYSYFK